MLRVSHIRSSVTTSRSSATRPNSQLINKSNRFYSSGSGVNTLLVVEHDNKSVLSSTLSAITAAKELGGDVTALVIGSAEGAKTVADETSRIEGVTSVMHVGGDVLARPIAELYTPVILSAHQEFKFSHIVAPHSVFGKNLLPRVAAKLDVSAVSDVIKVESSDTFIRPIYAGNALATVRSTDAVKLVTVRPTAFAKAALTDSPATVAARDVPQQLNTELTQFVSEELSQSDRPELTTAPIVISGGRGMKSGENFKMLYDMAAKLNAAVGASRAAVDAGYVPNDMQVGQTGKVVAPELYIAVGISGAIQHLAGMKDSKCIVAINKDPEAPIFQVADYGLAADLFKAVPELTEKLPQL